MGLPGAGLKRPGHEACTLKCGVWMPPPELSGPGNLMKMWVRL
jgi:hypothetical protein